jgi:hypothetical protein
MAPNKVRLLLKIGIGLLVVLVVLVACELGLDKDGATYLSMGDFFLGWYYTFPRVMAESMPDGWDWLVGILGLALLAANFYVGCGWYYRQRMGMNNLAATSSVAWRIRWTRALLGLYLLLVLSSTAAVGFFHQAYWLAVSPDPLVNHSRGFRNTSRQQLFMTGHAMHKYYGDRSHFPAGATMGKQGRLLHGWQTSLLPYLEDDDKNKTLYDQIRHDLPWNDPVNVVYFQTEVPEYLNPHIAEKHDAAGFALSHYAANAWILGSPQKLLPTSVEFLDSRKLLVGEVSSGFKPWGHPANWRDPALGLHGTPQTFGSRSWRGVDFLCVDGHVRRVRYDVDPQVLKALSDPRDKTPLDVRGILE